MNKLTTVLLIIFSCTIGLLQLSYAAAPDLTIGSASGYAGQSISIPVIADFSVPIGVSIYTITYDPGLLTLVSVSPGTAISATNWQTIYNPKAPGTVIIGSLCQTVACMSGGTALLNGTSQQIAVLNFTVNATPKATLTGPNLILSAINFDNTPITTFTNGTFTLSILGDVNGTGTVDINDAIAVLKFSLGLTTLTPAQLLLADTSKDGKVTAYDALLIAEYANGNIKGF